MSVLTYHIAPANTPCGWGEGNLKCGSGTLAIHVLESSLPVAQAGTALCGYHSPFDVREGEREYQQSQ